MRWLVGLLLVTACSPAPDATSASRSVVAVGLGTEVLRDHTGPIAWSTGADSLPDGDAAFFDGVWWTLVREVQPDLTPEIALDFAYGEVTTAVRGDLDGDGFLEVVVSYRHPARTVAWDPRPLATDSVGRSAHLGVVDPDGMALWLARRIPHPIGSLAVCDAMIVLGYTDFDGSPVGAAAATWTGFGFVLEPELTGPNTIGCSDVDGDGSSDPVVLRR